MKMKLKKTQVLVILIIFITIIALFVPNEYIAKQKFETATTYILNEQYEEAKNILDTIAESDNRNDLISLCDAYITYDSGDISSAYIHLKEIKNTFNNTLLRKTVNNFTDIVEKEYNYHLAEQEKAKESAKIIRSQSPPYIGMAESYINDTIWGTPDKIEKSIDYHHKKYNHKWIKYYWYDINSEISFAIATISYSKDGKQSEGFIDTLYINSAKNPHDNQYLRYGK